MGIRGKLPSIALPKIRSNGDIPWPAVKEDNIVAIANGVAAVIPNKG